MIVQPQQGFTLIELAVVIAIMAVLASVALPRMADTKAAKAAAARDLGNNIAAAYNIYIVENGGIPTSFSQFVKSTAALTSTDTQTISVFGAGGSSTACNVGTTTINCTSAFGIANAQYTLSSTGVTTAVTK